MNLLVVAGLLAAMATAESNSVSDWERKTVAKRRKAFMRKSEKDLDRWSRR